MLVVGMQNEGWRHSEWRADEAVIVRNVLKRQRQPCSAGVMLLVLKLKELGCAESGRWQVRQSAATAENRCLRQERAVGVKMKRDGRG